LVFSVTHRKVISNTKDDPKFDVNSTEWNDTHVVSNVGDLFPSGLIVMWHGLISAIPSGWVLCDGNNGTPDLRDKFVKGAPAGTGAGGTGGTSTLTHSGTDVSVSNHTVTQPSAHSSHTHTKGTLAVASHSTSSNRQGTSTGTIVTTATHTVSGDTGNESSSLTHSGTAVSAHSVTVTQPSNHTNVLPPYYEVLFIMKT